MATRRVGRDRLAPIVRAYICCRDQFTQALNRCPEAHLSAEGRAIASLALSLAGKLSVDEALRTAERVQLDNCEPNTASLLLIFWAAVSNMERRDEEARLLHRRAHLLIGDHTPLELQAALLVQEMALAHYSGNNVAANSLIDRALAILPRESPHYGRLLRNKCSMFCALGRGVEVKEELAWLATHWHDATAAAQLALMRLDDAVDTGRLQDAQKLVEEIERGPMAESLKTPKGEMQRLFLTLAVTRWYIFGHAPISASEPEMAGPKDLPPWAQVLDCLYRRRPDWALDAARQMTREHGQLIVTGNGLYTTNLLRAELATGHGEAAARLLLMRKEAGNFHYLDDFFNARVELLQGNRQAAAGYLASAVKSAEDYGATWRLAFEAALACELSAVDLIGLSRMALPDQAGSGEGNHLSSGVVVHSPERNEAARLLGLSQAMVTVRKTVKRYASLDASVLIVGETGTGKELVARALHKDGPRAAEPFLAVNCGAIAESLLESELFGHTSGAFTGAVKTHRGIFEEAGKGTVFLDEIGEISPRLQVALLRVLESGEVRPVGNSVARKTACRILAATNADLGALAETGRFRKDLLFRLQRLEITIPPLRERREDILFLAMHFFSEGQRNDSMPVLSPELRKVLSDYDWPGNVRELRNEVERMRLLKSDVGIYDLDALSDRLRPGQSTASPSPAAGKEVVPAPEAAAATCPPERLSTLRRQDRLRKLFHGYGRLNAREIMRILGVAGRTVTRDLRVLRVEGVIEKVEPTPSPRTHYFKLRT